MTAPLRNLSVDSSRIAEDIDSLAAITEPGHPYTRRAFTPIFLTGRAHLEKRFTAAGLTTRIDAAGNLIGRRAGRVPGLGTILVGSHSDTVPDGGRYDGIAGVVAGLEIARALHDQSVELDHDLEIVDFLAEEVSIFGVSCVGSRGMAGLVPNDWYDREVGDMSLEDGVVQAGGNPTLLNGTARTDIKAFLELHIEQGTVLENAGLDIGVVTAIAGITRIEIIVEGRADHAGTTVMGQRRDALVAAAQIVLGVEKLATKLASKGPHFAATVGEFRIEPNAANVVPSRVVLLIDARAELRPDMEKFIKKINALATKVADKTRVTVVQPRVLSDNFPTPSDPSILAILDAACDDLGAGHRRMASGAGHDTAWMARITKAAMVFIPCLGGRSHAPEEFATTDDIALGTAVLLEAVKRLDLQLQEPN